MEEPQFKHMKAVMETGFNPTHSFYRDVACILDQEPQRLLRLAHPLYIGDETHPGLIQQIVDVTAQKQFPMIEGLIARWNTYSPDMDPLHPKKLIATIIFLAQSTLDDLQCKLEVLDQWEQEFSPNTIPVERIRDVMGTYTKPGRTFPNAAVFYQQDGSIHPDANNHRTYKKLRFFPPNPIRLALLASIPYTLEDAVSMPDDIFQRTIIPLVHTRMFPHADRRLVLSVCALQ